MSITEHRETSSVDELYVELLKTLDRAGWRAVRLELVLRSKVPHGDGTVEPRYPMCGLQLDVELVGYLP